MAITSLKSGISTRSGMAGNTLIYPGSYESIASNTLSSTTQLITFSSIPATYTHLQLRMSARTNFAYATPIDTYIELNGDGSYTGYRNHRLSGNGTAATSTTSASYDVKNITPGASQAADVYSGVVVDILDYANTNKNTTIRYLGGVDLNGSGNVVLGSILWPFTNAVNQIKLSADGSFLAGSTFALYGIA